MKECITHHFACDCREAKFTALEAENTALRKRVAELEEALQGIVEDDSRYVSLQNQRANWDGRMQAARAALAKAKEVGDE